MKLIESKINMQRIRKIVLSALISVTLIGTAIPVTNGTVYAEDEKTDNSGTTVEETVVDKEIPAEDNNTEEATEGDKATEPEVPEEPGKGDEEAVAPEIPESDIIAEELTVGEKADLTDNIKNLPEGATVEVIDTINTTKANTGKAKVKVVFSNGTSRIVEIPFTVTEKATEPENPGTDWKK